MASLERKIENRAGFIAQRLQAELKHDLAVSGSRHSKTGAMVRATKVTSRRLDARRWRVTAENPLVQAATTDRGARPHIIEAKGKALRWSSGGTVIFARRVNHPGNRASHWFSDVMSRGSVHLILSRFVGR
jgi:hypothetical protein